MRKIEIYSSDCPLCKDTVEKIKSEACENCEVIIYDLNNDSAAYDRAKGLNIKSVPAVVIDGNLASCCENGGVNLETLKALGLGKAL